MHEYYEFKEVQMTSDVQFRRAMYWAGWPVAYKHISVCRGDHRFQLVEFRGRFFVELALTFGGATLLPCIIWWPRF